MADVEGEHLGDLQPFRHRHHGGIRSAKWEVGVAVDQDGDACEIACGQLTEGQQPGFQRRTNAASCWGVPNLDSM